MCMIMPEPIDGLDSGLVVQKGENKEVVYFLTPESLPVKDLPIRYWETEHKYFIIVSEWFVLAEALISANKAD